VSETSFEALAMIPPAWREFVRSGSYRRARASISADGREQALDVLARMRFEDDSRLKIDLELTSEDGANMARGLPITARERAVIALIAGGLETSEIAERLYISPSTVRTHVRNAMTKLGAHTRAQLVATAMEGVEVG